MLRGLVKPPFPNNELYDMKNEIKDLKDQLNLYKNKIDSLKVTSNIIVHNSSPNNELYIDMKTEIPYWKLYCDYIDNFESIVIKNIDKIYTNDLNNILVNFQKLNLIDRDQLFSQLEYFRLNLSYIHNFNIRSDTLIISTTDELINIIKYNCYYLKNYNSLDVADKFIELFGNKFDRSKYPIYQEHRQRILSLDYRLSMFSNGNGSTGIGKIISNDVKIGFNAHRIKILENNSITSLETIQKQINTIIKESVINRNEIKELKDQLELYKNKIDSLTDKKESTDINVFTKKIVGKQIVYKDIEEYIYDYSYMKSSREDLHKEIKTVYRIFQRMIQNKYIPEAILVVSTK